MESVRDLTISSDAILGAVMVLISFLPPDMRSDLRARLAPLDQETEDVVILDEDRWSCVSGPQGTIGIRIASAVGLANSVTNQIEGDAYIEVCTLAYVRSQRESGAWRGRWSLFTFCKLIWLETGMMKF